MKLFLDRYYNYGRMIPLYMFMFGSTFPSVSNIHFRTVVSVVDATTNGISTSSSVSKLNHHHQQQQEELQQQQYSKRKFVGANWKCNIETTNDVDQLIYTIKQQHKQYTQSSLSRNKSKTNIVDVCIFVPYIYLDRVQQQLKNTNICIGSQNIYEAIEPSSQSLSKSTSRSKSRLNIDKSLYKNTGTITTQMICNIGCHYVLLGHSDRRNHLYETNDWIGIKVRCVLDSNDTINVIITIGELKIHRILDIITIYILKQQLYAATQYIQNNEWHRIVIAYEPVWAIGHNAQPCQPNETQRIMKLLYTMIQNWYGTNAANQCRFTYTGSIDDTNCVSYSSIPHVDGFIIGRAGLDATKLMTIIRSLE